MTLDNQLVLDLAQEGWIEMWKAIKTHDDRSPLDWWLKFKAHGRMKRYVGDRHKSSLREIHSLGTPVPLYNNDSTASFGERTNEGSSVRDRSMDYFDELAAAYHEGEVAAAIDRLPGRQRLYVRMRFFNDASYNEILEEFKTSRSKVWQNAREKLRVDLAHLDPYKTEE